MGALPARFRKPRLLIVGCGDVGQRVASILNAYKSTQAQALRVLALTSSADRIPALRAQGIVPLLGNLDHAPSFQRLAGLATTQVLDAGQAAPPAASALVGELTLLVPMAGLTWWTSVGLEDVRTPDHRTPHPRTLAPSHLRTFAPSHLRTFAPSHLNHRIRTVLSCAASCGVKRDA